MKLRAQEYVMSLLSQEKNKSLELEIAKGLKKEFDTKFHPTWQCIVGKEYKELRKDLTLIIGKNFGSDVGFEDKHFIYFYMGSIAILLWKAG
jgi:dynein light chain LC8-type